MYLRQLQVGFMAVFAYIVGDKTSKAGLVIDPAAETDRIIAEAERNGIEIKYIVNTHGHVDHISGNADMKKKTGAKIIIHEADADMLVSTPATILNMFRAKNSPAADITVKDGDTIRPVIPRAGFHSTPTVTSSPETRCSRKAWAERICPGDPGIPWRKQSGKNF